MRIPICQPMRFDSIGEYYGVNCFFFSLTNHANQSCKAKKLDDMSIRLKTPGLICLNLCGRFTTKLMAILMGKRMQNPSLEPDLRGMVSHMAAIPTKCDTGSPIQTNSPWFVLGGYTYYTSINQGLHS